MHHPSFLLFLPFFLFLSFSHFTVSAQEVFQQVLFPDQSGEQLLQSVRVAYEPDVVYSYNSARDEMYTYIDNINGFIECVYSGDTIPINPNSSSPRSDAYNQGFNAEHTWPQSLGAGEGDAKSDLHHLRPARGDVNSSRGNMAFGFLAPNEVTRWWKDDTNQTQTPSGDLGLWSRTGTNRFQIRDQEKGNSARSVFYFFTIYTNETSASGSGFLSSMLDELYQYHKQDPVDIAEENRNNRVNAIQGNLNPFVIDTTLIRRIFFEDETPPVDTVPELSQTVLIDSTTSTLTLGASVLSDGGGTVSDRGFLVSVFDENADPQWGDEDVIQVSAGSGTGTYTATVEELDADVLYAIRAYATNEAGTGTGPVLLATTEDLIDYAMEIQVQDQAPNILTLTFGTAQDATAGYDIQYDQPAPPPPPSGAFDARLKVGGFSYFKAYQPTNSGTLEWQVEFAPASGQAPIQLSWNPDALPAEGSFRLVDPVGGQFVDVDMRATGEVTIEQSFINRLTLTHTLQEGVLQSYPSGWTLVSSPIAVEEAPGGGLAELMFPESLANTLYSYEGSYLAQEYLENGIGYWLNFSVPSEVSFNGYELIGQVVNLQPGWNLIGSVSSEAVLIDNNNILVPGTLYEFSGSYQQVETLQPGRGYWINASGAGSVMISATGM